MYTGKNPQTGNVPGKVYQWSGGRWAEICGDPLNRPTPVFLPGFAWTPDNGGQLVLAGGAYKTNGLGFSMLSDETWTCDEDGNWSPQPSAPLANPRVGGELVYNEEATKLMLLGGRDAMGPVMTMEITTDATSWET